jgi:SAM-dependent methyltransferase
MKGQCNICGWEGEFLHPENPREGLHCGNCASSARYRAVIYWLGRVMGEDGRPLHEWRKQPSLSLLESSARGAYPVMLADKFDYHATEFDPAKIAAGASPRHYADFQKLPHEDATFDLVIASDVFEHVRDDRAGYHEIFRTLRPGGTFLLTVPYDHDRKETIRRIDTSGPGDVMLLEPEYHGGGGHTLTYRNYGRDLLTLLRETGFSVFHARTDIPRLAIPSMSVIIAQKSDYIDFPRAGEAAGTMRHLGLLMPYRLFLLLKFNVQGLLQLLRSGGARGMRRLVGR